MTQLGIVLAGAAALGAYEAGVLDYVAHHVARDVGRGRLFEIVSGTSAGAINAVTLAAFADDPAVGTTRMCEVWSGLKLSRILRPSALEIVRSLAELTEPSARLLRALRIKRAQGGLLDPRPIEALLTTLLPIDRVEHNLRAGVLRALAISATDVATGRAVVFYQTSPAVAAWQGDGARAVPTRIGVVHAMASAAIPLLLPPVTIDGELYCDGGLRQMVPLSPSIHLGARRLLVVNPLTDSAHTGDDRARREASRSPMYLAGKALNALFADRTEVDLARLEQMTAILRAGRRRYGPTFDAEINASLESERGIHMHEVTALRVQPSKDLGRLAAEYAASSELARREGGMLGFVMARLAAGGATRTGDLLSYLLFDGGFASELIALGRGDAATLHDELCTLFDAAG